MTPVCGRAPSWTPYVCSVTVQYSCSCREPWGSAVQACVIGGFRKRVHDWNNGPRDLQNLEDLR